MLGNRSNQPSRFRTKDWVQTNDDTRGTYNANSQIKSKIKILKSIFCDYSNAKNYDASTGGPADAKPDERNKEAIFKNCALFTDCTSKINNNSRCRCCDANA